MFRQNQLSLSTFWVLTALDHLTAVLMTVIPNEEKRKNCEPAESKRIESILLDSTKIVKSGYWCCSSNLRSFQSQRLNSTLASHNCK